MLCEGYKANILFRFSIPSALCVHVYVSNLYFDISRPQSNFIQPFRYTLQVKCVDFGLSPTVSDRSSCKQAKIMLISFHCRGIDVVRNKIKMFAQQKVTLPKGRHKIIILDEADRYVYCRPLEYFILFISSSLKTRIKSEFLHPVITILRLTLPAFPSCQCLSLAVLLLTVSRKIVNRYICC